MIELYLDGTIASICIMPQLYEIDVQHFRCAAKHKSIYPKGWD